jgi:hypothetical protein
LIRFLCSPHDQLPGEVHVAWLLVRAAMAAAPGVSAVDGDAMVKVGAGPKAEAMGKQQ